MEAFDLLRRGELEAAISALVDQVRRAPAEVDHRYNLAGALVLNGDLDRADTHLDAISTMRPELTVAVSVFRNCLQAEEERRRVFAGRATPGRPPEPSPIVEHRIALRQRLLDGGDVAAAFAACADEPGTPGELDDVPFASLADHDDGLGGVLEVFAGGRYLWLPFANIRSLEFSAPRGLLDFSWAAAEFEDRDGRRATIHVPVMYAGTSTHANPLVRAGRVTEWEDERGVVFRGFGPRVLRVDDRELPLLDVRAVRFAASPNPSC